MKTIRFFIVAVLLVASTTLMAQSNARSFDESLTIRQTEQLVNSLDLSNKQAQQILTINQEYAFKTSLLFAQRRELLRLGYVDATVEQAFHEVCFNDMDAKIQAIKSVLSDEQLVAYSALTPDMSKGMWEPRRGMHDRARDNS